MIDFLKVKNLLLDKEKLFKIPVFFLIYKIPGFSGILGLVATLSRTKIYSSYIVQEKINYMFIYLVL